VVPSVVVLVMWCGCGRIDFDARRVTDAGADDGAVGVAFEVASCPPSYTETLGGTDHRYRVDATAVPWLDAVMMCRADQISPNAPTHLIVLGSEPERVALVQRATLPTWLGHSDRRTEGTFVAITLEDLGGYPAPQSPPWAFGEPNNQGAENCVEVTPTGELNDLGCSDGHAFVCECDPYPDTPSQY
jgi:hypothetical protein